MAAYFAHVGVFDPTNKDEDINGWIDPLDACYQLNGIAPAVAGADDTAAIADDASAQVKANETSRRAFLIAEIGPTGKILREHFNPPHSKEAAMVELDSRLQGKEEKVSDYILAIQRIAAKCNFSAQEYQSKLLYKMKTGVRCKHARMKMKGEADLTYEKAVKIAVGAEVVAAQDEVIQKQFKSQDEQNTSSKVEEESVQKVSSSPRGRGGQFRARGGWNQGSPSGRGQFVARGRGRGFFQSFQGNYRGGYQTGGYSSGYRGGFQQQGRGMPNSRGRGGFYSNVPQGDSNQSRECFVCGSTQHIQRYCPEICWTCGGRGHRSQQCPSSFNDNSNNNGNNSQQNSGEFQHQEKVGYVHQEGNGGAYYEDMFDDNWEPNIPETVGKINCDMKQDQDCVTVTYSEFDLDKCFMDIDENNNNVECDIKQVINEDLYDGVWYDEFEGTWKQECDKYVINDDESTLANNLVYFEVVAQVKSHARSSDSSSVNVYVNVNNQRLKLSIDSGSKETLLPIFMFKDYFRNLRLTPSRAILTSVEGESIKVIGECKVHVTDTKGKSHELSILVVDSRSLKIPLLGRKWLDKICPEWRNKLFCLLGELAEEIVNLVDEASETVVNLRKLFPKVFSKNKNSAIEGFEATIMLKENAVPIIAKEYPIPFYLRERVINKLWEDVDSGKAKIVTQPRWASPMFAIEKPNKDVEVVGNIDTLYDTPLNYEIVSHETRKDKVLQKVADYVVQGWPQKCPEKGLEPYFNNRIFLNLRHDCVMFGDRVIIPSVLRKRVLARLHDGHPGIVRSKMLARNSFWWPGISEEIDNNGRQCQACSIVNFRPASNETVSWPDPGEPWVRVHMDFFDFKSNKFFLLEDA
ncbi:hypothetical protein KUF71_002531 [Frankliniella fusca]|uniref:RNA-directed DNA polymerase n=1 Tax=Frankliniella fusca TaxID=407009 RepID=A0AAE1LLV9_9NEOP|nr:hypothetical protein KUF71_002531 [Frankliniella fusca]